MGLRFENRNQRLGNCGFFTTLQATTCRASRSVRIHTQYVPPLHLHAPSSRQAVKPSRELIRHHCRKRTIHSTSAEMCFAVMVASSCLKKGAFVPRRLESTVTSVDIIHQGMSQLLDTCPVTDSKEQNT